MKATEILQDQTDLQGLLREMSLDVITPADETIQAGRLLWAMGHEIKNYADRTDEAADADYLKVLDSVRRLPLANETVRRLDEGLLDICLDVLGASDCSPREKQAAELMSLSLGADQIAKQKGQTLLSKYQTSTGEAKQAVEAYLYVADISVASLRRPTQFKTSLQRATDKLRLITEVPKQRTGTAALIGILGLSGLSAGPAYGSVTSSSEVTVTAGLSSMPDGQALQSTESALPKSASTSLNTVMVTPGLGPNVEVPKASPANPQTASVEVRTGLSGSVSAADLKPKDAKLPDQQVDVKAGLGIQSADQLPAQNQPKTPAQATPDLQVGQPATTTPAPEAVAVTPAAPSNIDNTAPKASPSETLTVPVPDNNVNQAPNETPQQTIERLIKSHDIDATSYAIRKLYGVNGVNSQPVNEALIKAIDGQTETLKQQILKASHDDPAYTDKAIAALAYLDAAAKNPTILDNPDVASFLNDLSDLGEYYHNQIYSPYLDDAAAKLASNDYGALNGIDDRYKPMLVEALAYVNLGGISDSDQDAKIQAIQDAEAAAAKQAADENAKLQAAAESAKSAGTTSPESQALQTMIAQATDANQQRIYTAFKYFIDHGFTPEQSTGIIGNLLLESAGTMNPGIKQGGGGPGRGIAQWGSWNKDHTIGGRFTGLVNFAKAQGKNWDDLDVQLDFVMFEFSTSQQGAFNQIKAAQTPRDAAAAFMKLYERPADKSDKATDARTSRGTPVLDAYHQMVDQVNQARAAAAADAQKAAQAQAEAARQAQAQGLSTAQGNQLLEMYKDESDNSQFKDSYNAIDNYQCVSFVEFVLMKFSQTHPNNDFFKFLGNGKDVTAKLAQRGYAVDHTPAPLSVVSLPAGFHTGIFDKSGKEFVTNAEFGHTGVVISVAANGDIVMAQTGAPKGVHYKYLSTIKASLAAQLTYAHTEADLASILNDPAMQGK